MVEPSSNGDNGMKIYPTAQFKANIDRSHLIINNLPYHPLNQINRTERNSKSDRDQMNFD